MIVNYRGQIMCEITNTNVTYAAAMINVQELRAYREKGAVFTLPYTTPEMWARIYFSLAGKFPYPKNSHLSGPSPVYQERKKLMREVVGQMIDSSVIKGP